MGKLRRKCNLKNILRKKHKNIYLYFVSKINHRTFLSINVINTMSINGWEATSEGKYEILLYGARS